MMVVITMSNCPLKLRGDLSKWLIEIDTCVFVGNLSARVRDVVWERICDHIKNGRASMAFSTNGEQKLDFRIHNTDWEPVDFDGIKLVRRNLETESDADYKKRSKAVISHKQHISQAVKKAADSFDEYVVIDMETTGLKYEDEIIELAAVHIKKGAVTNQFSTLVQCEKTIPQEITELTGITNKEVSDNGIPLESALDSFIQFCGDCPMLGHNINFDMKYLQKACAKAKRPPIKNRLTDTMKISHKKLEDLSSFGLTAVAKHLGLEYNRTHRALDDCLLVYGIYEKLKEI